MSLQSHQIGPPFPEGGATYSDIDVPRESSTGELIKKELGLVEAVAVCVGVIIGTGIFISPTGVLREAGSVGFALIIWLLCGLMATLGALCYAELGTMIPKSGGDFAYIFGAFGSLPGFLFVWDAVIIFVPVGNAITALTFATYVLDPIYGSCPVPNAAIRLIAGVAICFFTFLNCWNVKLISKVQNVFFFTKVAALVIIIVAGLYALMTGSVGSFHEPFRGSEFSPGKIAVAIYQGIFSYSGWNYLNYITEELHEPEKNLPRAIFISLPFVTSLYLLANVAYLAVLSPVTMLTSDAIAVTFGDKMLGFVRFIMPAFVAISALGGLCVHIMTSSRLCFVGARCGLLPKCLALVNIKYHTPMASLIFLGLVSLAVLASDNISRLIDFASFVESGFILTSISTLFYYRWTRPDARRPIRVPFFVPIIVWLTWLFLVIFPVTERPVEVGIAVGITFLGLPVYFLFVRSKSGCLESMNRSLAVFFQKVLYSVIPEEEC